MQNRELERLMAVDRFLKLKISRENELLEIAQTAAKICGTDIAMITLIDEHTQYIKIGVGIEDLMVAREDSFCNYLIAQNEVIVIPDTMEDELFCSILGDQPFNIQFYAGAPLITLDGLKLGSLCVLGTSPADLSEMQSLMLSTLALQVVHILEFDYSLQIMKNQFLEAKKNEFALRSIFESSASHLLLIDLDLKIVFVNKVISDYMKLHYNKIFAIGTTVTDVLLDDFLYDFIINFNKAKAGERVLIEKTHVGPLGEIWWQFKYSPAHDADGKIIGVTFTAADITTLKKTQFKIFEKEQSLHAIALIQSHEIRRPVSSILGLINVIKLNDYKAEEEALLLLEKAAQELDSKIKDIVIHAMDKEP
jgi:PAS domain S-box-containing protein